MGVEFVQKIADTNVGVRPPRCKFSANPLLPPVFLASIPPTISQPLATNRGRSTASQISLPATVFATVESGFRLRRADPHSQISIRLSI